MTPTGASGKEGTEIDEAFEIIKDAITSLMKTSIIIRDATPRDRYVKANASTKHPFLASFDIAHVGHKYPKIESEGCAWLKDRLGKAITQRRQYLKYCREHRAKFEPQDKEDLRPSGTTSQIDILQSNTTSRGQTESRGHPKTLRSLPVSALAPTDASTLQAPLLKPVEEGRQDTAEELSDSHSQTSYATSVQDNEIDSGMYPPRLMDITSTFPFECPYCWNMQQCRTERLWR